MQRTQWGRSSPQIKLMMTYEQITTKTYILNLQPSAKVKSVMKFLCRVIHHQIIRVQMNLTHHELSNTILILVYVYCITIEPVSV